jgi:ubiquinone/menaquinone biosynthesis C-methylase UbiE
MSEPLKFYDNTYGNFSESILQEVRNEAFGMDIGQNSWLTYDEHLKFILHLRANPLSRILEVACGSGRPALRIAEVSGARVVGIDINEKGISTAKELARTMKLDSLVQFQVADGSKSLPFDDESFDSLICVDSINHLPNRQSVLREWCRVLKPGGRLLFTDPITVTGILSNVEIAIRSSVGFFLFTPPGVDEIILKESSFELLDKEDLTSNMEVVSKRWYEARSKRREALVKIEGEVEYEGLQKFLEVTHTLSCERRLSRFAYLGKRI